ncbi:hypothetical protein [Nocardioides bizhenqiangii]|uniref:Uncharacterized protein n=1 Tax=Nocardioides bizhenqiangii TaxID=3095076 RepID=A0ABZ0ZJ05_9ACTN|nr:hypothetical protein [Nocardioides sp. HM61]WQQ24519.1 hypothetical protein SHK19_11095 [Nocardioides sp. HM61]
MPPSPRRDGTLRRGAVFIPAGSIHGTMYIGDEPVRIRAVYPSTTVRMDMVERNPLPGTEGQPPRVSVYDMATGSFTILHETALPPDFR